MRFSERIKFVKLDESYYNPDLGKFIENGKIIKVMPCKLSSMGVERTNELFGSLNRKITIAVLQNPYDKPFDYVEIDKNKYQVQRHSDYKKGVLFLEGVSNE